MTYDETIKFLFESLPVWEQNGADAYKPGLERTLRFASHTGNPQQKFRTVHVAGTNGKGSTSSMLAAVLQAAGYRTGLYTSPHLVDFRERIRVDGAMIPEEAVVGFAERYRDEMLGCGLTFFEMATTMAFWWFSREGCDVAIIEAGLGGRLDTTNIITPVVSVITNIGLEHTQYLGSTITAIAGEKAGIIKPGVQVVVGETDSESARVFRSRAAELHAPIVFADMVDVSDNAGDVFAGVAGILAGTPDLTPSLPHDLTLDLAGDYQQKNLRTVLAAVEVLRKTFEIPDEAVRRGLENTVALTCLRGRWEVMSHSPLVVCDTAHNAHGFAEVAAQLDRHLEERSARSERGKLFMVLGFAADKDLSAIIRLLPRDAHYILTEAATARAMPAEELARRFASRLAQPDTDETGNNEAVATTTTVPATDPATIETVLPVSSAVGRALSLAAENDTVYIGGSNFVVGEYLSSLSRG